MIPKLDSLSASKSIYLSFLQTLEKSGFSGEIETAAAQRLAMSTDNSVYQLLPQAVLYPKHTADLVSIAKLASLSDYKEVVFCPRGGGTSTNGQSLSEGIIVDLSRHMNRILEINVEQAWARVQTGVVKDQLDAEIKKYGLFFAPELSTSNRATIGGMINTNAAGQGSCIYGSTRDHLLETETVLLDGSLLRSYALNNMEFAQACEGQTLSAQIHRLADSIYSKHKDKIDRIFPKLNRCLTGYDLATIRDAEGKFNLNSVLCGSEGTLGFISEAKIKLSPKPKHTALVVVHYSDFDTCLRDTSELMKTKPSSIETIDSKVLLLAMGDISWQHVENFFPPDTSPRARGVNLVEYTSDSELALQKKINTVSKTLRKKIAKAKNHIIKNKDNNNESACLGYTLTFETQEIENIWHMRKRAVGLLGNTQGEARPVPFVEDTAVPPENLADFILEFRQILDNHQLDYGMFGHVDAGVLHVRPALDFKNPDHEALAWKISDELAELTKKYGGLLWGEHGKGFRSAYNPDVFGPLYPQLQRIKAAFDPRNQLNPGKIATPAEDIPLRQINDVTTRGSRDRHIPASTWQHFNKALFCNGNGACFNWDSSDVMCPSFKVSGDRVHSPKGRATLFKEWLRLMAEKGVSVEQALLPKKKWQKIRDYPAKWIHYFSRSTDFSHQVYESMAGCLACKACSSQCPIKVDVPSFRSQFLAIYHTRYPRPFKDYLVASLEFTLPFLAKHAWLYKLTIDNRFVRYLSGLLTDLSDIPTVSGFIPEQFGIELADEKKLAQLSDEEKLRTVIIVQDAFTRFYETQLLVDTAELLHQLGFKALLAPYTANGKPLHVHGMLEKFQTIAEKNAVQLKNLAHYGVPLIGIEPSMTLAYRSEYVELLGKDQCPEVKLLQTWLAENKNLFTVRETPKSRTRYKLMPHCTERAYDGQSLRQWQEVFEQLGQQLDLQEVGCCGMAGTYGHEKRNLVNSKKLYAMNWKEAVEHWGATGTLLATGYSCRSQANRESRSQLKHPVQALLDVLLRTDLLKKHYYGTQKI